MITDTPELRRLVLIAQQRRARYISIKIPIAMSQDDFEAADAALERANDASIALMRATADLLDYLQSQIDS